MELTKEQIQQIDNYILVCGIKYYDVRMEIVDHFANLLEQKLDKNPNLDFKKEIENIHKNFDENGFIDFIKEKKVSVKNRFYSQTLEHLKTFFNLPKIIISMVIFFGLVFIMNAIQEKENFFSILSFILIALGFRLLFNVNIRDANKKSFLSLSLTMDFFNVFYVLVMIFNFIVRYRNDVDLLNSTINYIQIFLFVFLLLFYWSGETVYYQNKKLLKEQYPQIIG